MSKRMLALIGVCLAVSFPAATRAGGLILYETGTPDQATASAGWAARAEDAATVLTNPAGMTRLEGADLLLGLQALYADVEFTPDARTTTSGGSGGNPIGLFPGGGAYYVHPTTDRLWLGVAVTGNFGLGLDYDDDWAGRYYAQDATMLGISVLPAIAWKASDTVSVGAALNATYGIMETRVAVNNVLPSAPDGGLEIEDTVWGYGANVGILYEPRASDRFGLTYTMPVSLDFEDVPAYTDLAPGMSAALGAAGLLDAELDLSVKIPQTATASFVHETGGRWTILGNLGWQDWSSFGKVDVVIDSEDPTSLTADLNFQDTWQAALGARERDHGDWVWSFGIAYDSSCVDDADRTPTLPVGESWRFGVGARRALSDRLDLNLSYELVWGGTLAVDQERGPLSGRLAGAYEDTSMHFLAASLRWRL